MLIIGCDFHTSYQQFSSGNMTNDGLNTLVYDAENHVTSATSGSGSGTYTYDGSGQRVKKIGGGNTIVTIFAGAQVLAEYVNGAAPSSPTDEYIYAGSMKIASIQSGTTNYWHNDHLSPRVRTDTSGNVSDQRATFPFGETWYSPGAFPYMLTTYYRDYEASGNDYALARSYISRFGRFSSRDPLSGLLSNPQSFNRYAYTENDPVNLADPSGLHPILSEPPPPPPGGWQSWLFDMFILGGDPGSDLDITDGTSVWNGEEWQEIDAPGAIFDLNWFQNGPTWDQAMGLAGPGQQPPPPCQKERNASPATYDFIQNNYNDASTLATLMGTTAANVLGLSSVESGNGSSNLAVNYNNYFGLTYPFPGTGNAYHSPNGYSYSTYGSPGFWNSGVSFMRS